MKSVQLHMYNNLYKGKYFNFIYPIIMILSAGGQWNGFSSN